MGAICNKRNKQINANKQKDSDRINSNEPKNNDPSGKNSKGDFEPSNPHEKMPEVSDKESKKTFIFTNIINRETDFKEITKNITSFLTSDESPSEKLRVSLMIIKDLIEEEEPADRGNLMANFFDVIERHYPKLCEDFEKINQSSKPLVKLLQISELLLDKFSDEKQRKEIVDRTYKFLNEKEMVITDWRFLRKLCEQWEGEKLGISASWKGDLVQGFLKRIEKTKRALLWKNETEGVKYAKEMIDAISSLSEETLFKFLLMGRFDKEKTGKKESFSMIVGDEGGLFLLMNSVPSGSRQEKCILEAGVSEEFLTQKRGEPDNKVILGKGAFGKVRLALSILGSLSVDIGQLVCVKKSLPIGAKKSKETNLLKNITDSTLEDFFARKLNDSIHAPMPLDMAILTSNLNDKKHRKGYLFMELVPENTADKIFAEKKHQKWEYQKPYILAVMKTTNGLLVKERVFNSDLKPQNTLFDPISRKMAIIDLGSSLLISQEQSLETFDASAGGFGVSEPYCPPEIKDENQLEKINLKKAISYLCGVTIAEVTCDFPVLKKGKDLLENWNLTAENTDLDAHSKKLFVGIIKGLIEKDYRKRMDLSVAIENIEKIGLNVDEIMKRAVSEQYIEKVKKLLRENNSGVLGLNEDINETRKKGIIEQKVVQNNPKHFKHQKSKEISEDLDDFTNNSKLDESLLVLLGEAGSGKSLALQLRFVREIEEWEYGKKALPLFFNMADEVDLEKVINRINSMLGCNIKLEDSHDEIHLFIDSYDEGRPGEFFKAKEQEEINKEKNEFEKVIGHYFEKLRSIRRRKIVISCRTDFIQSQAFNLNEFQVRNPDCLSVRYIAPIDYGAAGLEHDKGSGIYFQVREWLKRENSSGNAEEIIRKLKKLAIEGRMKTGMMFNMIMNILLLMQEESTNDIRLRGYEIFRRTVREEFRVNWGKAVCRQRNLDKKSEEKLRLAIKNEIEKVLKFSEDDKETLIVKNDIELIWEGMERIGELIAAEMSLKKSNRISYSEVEGLVEGKGKYNVMGKYYDSDERTEWKTLYQILRIMGLKLKKRRSIYIGSEDKDGINLSDKNKDIIDIGFRHDTYKNYFLMRGLKRLLPVILRDLSQKSIPDLVKDQSIAVAALLEEKAVIYNYELLRLFGEEIRFDKDTSLREGLRKALFFLQKQGREMKPILSPSPALNQVISEKPKLPSSAVIMSLLVAGGYEFWAEDLSDLDLEGANMRGGHFIMSKFERTNLRNANLRHSNMSQVTFAKADMRGLRLGVWPDLVGDLGEVNSVCFSPDGKRLATGSKVKYLNKINESAKIWNSESGEPVKTLKQFGSVNSVCFSLDGKRIACGGADLVLKIWDCESGDCLQSLKGHSQEIISVCFSADSKKIASASKDKSVKIWESANGECLLTPLGHSSFVLSVCFSPDSERLASGGAHGDHTIKIWDSARGECIQTLSGHSQAVTSVVYSPDGKNIASGSVDETVKIWDSKNGECVQTLDSGSVLSVCFTPCGKRLASGSADETVRIWDWESGERIQTLAGHSGFVHSVCFSPDGRRLASGSWDESVKIWDTGETEECVQTLVGHFWEVTSVCYSPDGKTLVSGSREKEVKIWDSESGECLQTLLGHSDIVFSVCFSPDGKRIGSGSYDKTVNIFNSTSGECILKLSGHSDTVRSVCFSPDGKKVGSGSDDKSARIWDSESGECIQTLAEHSGEVNSVCFSPDGKGLATASSDNTLKIWGTASGECVKTLLGHLNALRSVCFSPDGKRLVSGGDDSSIFIWDSASGQCILKLLGHSDIVLSVCFSSDGKLIGSGGCDKSVRIWDSESGECLQTLAGHSESVFSVCFRPDGKELVSGSEDKSLKFWYRISGESLETIKGIKHDDYVTQCEKLKMTMFFLKWTLKLIEDEFRCDSCTIVDCLFDRENPADARNKIVFSRRKGIMIRE